MMQSKQAVAQCYGSAVTGESIDWQLGYRLGFGEHRSGYLNAQRLNPYTKCQMS